MVSDRLTLRRPGRDLGNSLSVLARVGGERGEVDAFASARTRAVSTTNAGSLRRPRWGTGEIRRVGLDQQPVERNVARQRAQVG